MIDIITGGSGFLGQRLMQKIGPGAFAVPHDAIMDAAWPDCDRFFFLSTYGNMVGQTDIPEIIRANIGHLGYVLGAYIALPTGYRESICNHFTFVSSSSVNLPVQTPYSHAKRAAEEMVLASCLPACVVRPFSITGVGEQPEHLIPTLIRSCLEGELMQFVPEPVHDFVDVKDVVNGLIALAERKATGVFEFGWGVMWSNEEVRRLVENITGKNARIREVKALRDYDNKHWVCFDGRAQAFGWKPKKTLQTSIEEMVAAYKFRK